MLPESFSLHFRQPRWSRVAVVCVLVHALAGGLVSAQQADSQPLLNRQSAHPHNPLRIQSSPVINRVAVQTIAPVDLCVTSGNLTFVADPGARCVFRIDSQANVSLAFSDLDGIRQLETDADGNLYVLTSASAESAIHLSSASGTQMTLYRFPFSSVCFIRSKVGEFLVGSRDKLHIISTDSTQTTVPLPHPPLDLAMNAGGGIRILLQNGVVASTTGEGELASPFRAIPGSQRIVFMPDGTMATLVSSAATPDGRPGLYSVCPAAALDAEFKPVMWLPQGTAAVGFDTLGNLTLANPELRAVTRVTSRFRVPCPHCSESLELILCPELNPAGESASF